jgi:hypothetical protein
MWHRRWGTAWEVSADWLNVKMRRSCRTVILCFVLLLLVTAFYAREQPYEAVAWNASTQAEGAAEAPSRDTQWDTVDIDSDQQSGTSYWSQFYPEVLALPFVAVAATYSSSAGFIDGIQMLLHTMQGSPPICTLMASPSEQRLLSTWVGCSKLLNSMCNIISQCRRWDHLELPTNFEVRTDSDWLQVFLVLVHYQVAE